MCHAYISRNEIESQLTSLNQEIQYYLLRQQPLTPHTPLPGSTPITPTTMDNSGFPNGK